MGGEKLLRREERERQEGRSRPTRVSFAQERTRTPHIQQAGGMHRPVGPKRKRVGQKGE